MTEKRLQDTDVRNSADLLTEPSVKKKRLLSWRMTRFQRKICLALTILALFILVVLKILSPYDRIPADGTGLEFVPQEDHGDGGGGDAEVQVIKKPWVEKFVSVFNRSVPDEDFPPPNYNLHVFYYTWYGNPRYDGKFIHWNHPLLPHWNPKIVPEYETGTHTPPDDIGASFYPALGPYSSRDPSVIEAHMQQLRTAAIGEIELDLLFLKRKDRSIFMTLLSNVL